MNDNKRKDAPEENVSEYGRREFLYRYIIIAVSFALICVVYIISALRIQHIYGGDKNDVSEEYGTRTVTVSAVRGEIYDRNGILLVSNEYNYYLIYDYSAMSPKKSEQNEGILAILSALKMGECEIENQCPFKGTYPSFTYDVEIGRASCRERV